METRADALNDSSEPLGSNRRRRGNGLAHWAHWLRAGAAGALLAAAPMAAEADRITDFAPFVFDTETQNLLYLEGDINSQTDFRLSRALRQFPSVDTLVLSSRGGTVYDGLSMASTIHDRGLKTQIPAGGECFSACAYMFFAGSERGSEGSLGVHRLAGLGDDITFGQEVLSEVFATLYSYGVPFEIILKMLQTPPERMFIYSPSQLQELNLLGSVAPSPATQSAALRAGDPQSFADYFEQRGGSPQVSTDPYGDPLIVFTERNVPHYLLFWDCTDNGGCRSVQFYTEYPTDGSAPANALNAWNNGAGRRFLRASSDNTTIILEMDIPAGLDGISERDFTLLLDLWMLRKGEFEAQFGF